MKKMSFSERRSRTTKGVPNIPASSHSLKERFFRNLLRAFSALVSASSSSSLSMETAKFASRVCGGWAQSDGTQPPGSRAFCVGSAMSSMSVMGSVASVSVPDVSGGIVITPAVGMFFLIFFFFFGLSTFLLTE